MVDFRNMVAVVTGGLSGIGRACCELLAREGAAVAVLDAREISRDDGTTGPELAERLGNGSRFHACDVSSESDVDRAFDFVGQVFGRVDAVIHCAGVTVFKPLDELSGKDFDFVMGVNVRGTFLVCKRAIRDMRSNENGGAIVNVASNFAFVAAPETSVYSASKGAVVSMTKGLALEAGPHGIRVNALCPGATATEFNRQYRDSRPDIVAAWKAKTPLQMPGRDEFLAVAGDIAHAAAFLASDKSLYMTGASLVIDGGWNAE